MNPVARPTTASALAVLPRTRERTLRTVTWLQGTRVFRGDTGSMADNMDRAASVLFAASGFATVAPDYLGLAAIAGIAGPYDIRGQEIPAALDGRLDDISATLYLAYAITAWNRVHRLYDSPRAGPAVRGHRRPLHVRGTCPPTGPDLVRHPPLSPLPDPSGTS